MYPADHFFEHNFYAFYFPKTYAWFSREMLLFRFTAKNGIYAFFLFDNGMIFSYAAEVKLFSN